MKNRIIALVLLTSVMGARAMDMDVNQAVKTLKSFGATQLGGFVESVVPLIQKTMQKWEESAQDVTVYGKKVYGIVQDTKGDWNLLASRLNELKDSGVALATTILEKEGVRDLLTDIYTMLRYDGRLGTFVFSKNTNPSDIANLLTISGLGKFAPAVEVGLSEAQNIAPVIRDQIFDKISPHVMAIFDIINKREMNTRFDELKMHTVLAFMILISNPDVIQTMFNVYNELNTNMEIRNLILEYGSKYGLNEDLYTSFINYIGGILNKIVELVPPVEMAK